MDRKHLLKYIVLSLFVTIALVSIAGVSLANGDDQTPVTAPEASTLAIMSTGIFGWLIRFARRRFAEFKRGFDIVVSVLGIMITAPLMAAAIIFIKVVSPGPAIFKQKRVGIDGNEFTIYKFRTMRLDAEKASGPMWAQEDDPRIIKFGKNIRKSHVDELPQLFNVLKGDMSIVGPRPERAVFIKDLKEEIPDYLDRLAVKPGITGLAQVWHKYDETIKDVKKKVRYDLLYIRKMCLMVDIRILLNTIVVVLTGRGAR